jgi:hypothetical protein
MRMPENEPDPAGNTQQFRAFVQKGEDGSAQSRGTKIGLIIGIVAVIAVVVVLAVVFLAL